MVIEMPCRDWEIGQWATKTNDFIRHMLNPPLDGCSVDHMNEVDDFLDVHCLSGLFNKVCYRIKAFFRFCRLLPCFFVTCLCFSVQKIRFLGLRTLHTIEQLGSLRRVRSVLGDEHTQMASHDRFRRGGQGRYGDAGGAQGCEVFVSATRTLFSSGRSKALLSGLLRLLALGC